MILVLHFRQQPLQFSQQSLQYLLLQTTHICILLFSQSFPQMSQLENFILLFFVFLYILFLNKDMCFYGIFYFLDLFLAIFIENNHFFIKILPLSIVITLTSSSTMSNFVVVIKV